jgi:penicillin-binding protein 2
MNLHSNQDPIVREYVRYFQTAREVVADVNRRNRRHSLPWLVLGNLPTLFGVLVFLFSGGWSGHQWALTLVYAGVFLSLFILGPYVWARSEEEFRKKGAEIGLTLNGFEEFFRLYRKRYWPIRVPSGGEKRERFLTLTEEQTVRGGRSNLKRSLLIWYSFTAVAVVVAAVILIRGSGGAITDLGEKLRSTGTSLPIGIAVTQAPTPESAARAFLDGWQNKDYAKMYALLSSLSRDAMSEAEFVSFYDEVSLNTTSRSLDYQILSVEMTPTDATVGFQVTLHTILMGDIIRQNRMLLKYQQGGWKVAWDSRTALPELENGNKLMIHRDYPARGNIYDRNGLALAAEGEAVEIGIVSGEITNEETVVTYVALALKMPREMVRIMIDYNHPDWYIPIGDANKDDIEQYYGMLRTLGGVRLTTTMMRYYFGGGVASHVIGYTQQPSKENLAYYQSLGYAGDERVGASGLEAWGEQYLAGRPGAQLWVTTATGSNLALMAESEPQAAMAIYTTLDRDLQQQMEQTLMGPFTGAAVVLNRNTGEVLAMMSSPGYDSNLFDPSSFNGTYNNGALVQEIIDDARHPLVNRATRGLYPLGSVFKIITMSAGLESGLFTPNSVYNDVNGYFTELEGFTGTDWTIERDMKPQGKITLEQCLERSCNTCFWHVGLTLYYHDAWLVPNMAMAFGLGSPTGITGVEEEAGLVPNPGWKHDTQNGADWTGGDALNQAIGQGMLEVTPLQVADFVAAVGNGGTLNRPQILLSIRPPIGDAAFTFKPEMRGKLPVSPENLAAVQRAMTAVVNNPKGTARYRFYGISDIVRIAGKTGTAQTTPYDLPHSWFVAYTFSEKPNKPDIAVAVIVEKIGEGSTYAAPMARRIIEIYFQGRPTSRYQWESEYGFRGTSTPEVTEEPSATPAE